MSANSSTYQLSLDKVSHHFDELKILKDISFSVQPGEFIVLVGPSGCGKTTLLNLISGHLIPSHGIVLRNGITRTVYQSDGLFPWLTVSENISMGLSNKQLNNSKGISSAQTSNELEELLALIHLSDFKDHYPHELSGGMKQRVELARALAGDSDILLMDEPFSALDYQTRLRMRNELIRLLAQRKRTVVFVTHDIEEAAQLADRVFVLSQRPSSIVRELSIKASRPRSIDHPEVISAMKTVLDELGLQAPGNPAISAFDNINPK